MSYLIIIFVVTVIYVLFLIGIIQTAFQENEGKSGYLKVELEIVDDIPGELGYGKNLNQDNLYIAAQHNGSLRYNSKIKVSRKAIVEYPDTIEQAFYHEMGHSVHNMLKPGYSELGFAELFAEAFAHLCLGEDVPKSLALSIQRCNKFEIEISSENYEKASCMLKYVKEDGSLIENAQKTYSEMFVPMLEKEK